MKPSSNSTKSQISENHNLILVSNTGLGFVKHAVNSFLKPHSLCLFKCLHQITHGYLKAKDKLALLQAVN